MASCREILTDVLDWCFTHTNISNAKGRDIEGSQVNFIHYAAEKGYIYVVKKLVESGFNIDSPAPNYSAKTPLHYASQNGHLEVATLLLQNGANVNCQDSCQWTPLHYASSYGSLELVNLLLQHGANVNNQSSEHLRPLHHASLNGHLEVARLLLQKGADINSQNYLKETPLHYATTWGKKEIVKLLLDNGCDVDLKNVYGKTAGDVAFLMGFLDIMEMISKRSFKRRISNTMPREESSSNLDDCIICYERKDGIFAFLPCGHACTCEKCCVKILGMSDSTCLICRREVKEYKKIFV